MNEAAAESAIFEHAAAFVRHDLGWEPLPAQSFTAISRQLAAINAMPSEALLDEVSTVIYAVALGAYREGSRRGDPGARIGAMLSAYVLEEVRPPSRHLHLV